MDERLRPIERLKHSQEYLSLFSKGRCVHVSCFRVHYRPNGRAFSRLGLVVSRKVGDAVRRNRVKRLLREVFRRNKGGIPFPMDIVLVPRNGLRTHRDYLGAFRDFLEKARKEAAAREPARGASGEPQSRREEGGANP
jgi:ribonuclease P protein component